jgi:hypothetical protein
MALSSYLAGNKTNLMPNWGNKWRYRKDLEAIARQMLPDCSFEVAFVSGTDPGAWGHAANVLFDARLRGTVLAHLRGMLAQGPPAAWYRDLHGRTLPIQPPLALGIARFLYMQRIAFGSKPVRWLADGTLISPGYNKTSAEGVAATDKFGAVKPQIPSMLKRLEGMTADAARIIQRAPADPHGDGEGDAQSPYARLELIDPPYVDTSKYPHAFSRERVVQRARAQRANGWAGMVTETEPIRELLGDGWGCEEITKTRNGASPVRSKKREFVTFCDGRR